MRIALVFNPAAGASLMAKHNLPEENAEATLVQILHDLGMDAELYKTTPEDPGEGIAKQLATEHTDLVIVAGGDGTVRSVARGLLGSESILGIIPAGTMNNLASSMGIPDTLEEACAVFVNGQVYAIDVGSINQHIFLEVAGVGIEAVLFPAAEAVKSRGLLSTLKGVVDGLYQLIQFHPPKIHITLDNERPHSYRAIQVTISNSPYYGVHLNVAPDIFLNDGLLDVVIYKNFSKIEYLRHALSISRGRRQFTPKVVHRRVKLLSIKSHEEIELQADGIVLGHTPAEVKILPKALKVQVPQKPGPGLLTETMQAIQRQRRTRRKKPVHV